MRKFISTCFAVSFIAAILMLVLPSAAHAHSYDVTATCESGLIVNAHSNYEGDSANNLLTLTVNGASTSFPFNRYGITQGVSFPNDGTITSWSWSIDANRNHGNPTAYDQSGQGMTGPCGQATTTTTTTTIEETTTSTTIPATTTTVPDTTTTVSSTSPTTLPPSTSTSVASTTTAPEPTTSTSPPAPTTSVDPCKGGLFDPACPATVTTPANTTPVDIPEVPITAPTPPPMTELPATGSAALGFSIAGLAAIVLGLIFIGIKDRR